MESKTPSVEACECGKCGGNMDRPSTGADVGRSFEEPYVSRDVQCEECKAPGLITITQDGTNFSGYAEPGEYLSFDDDD